MTEPTLLLGLEEIDRTIRRMVKEIAQRIPNSEDAVLVGIRTHGVTLARRIHKLLALEYEWDLPLGILDTTLYRDDFSQLDQQPMVRETSINFDVTDKIVILIDDVLYTGRTVRCALDAIMDFGRPRSILLTALVDRGLRELPIQPDVVGVEVDTTPDQAVEVHFSESDGEDGVWIHKEPDTLT